MPNPRKSIQPLPGYTAEDVHRLRAVWRAMVHRCCNPRSGNYDNYGGRGITVAPVWRGTARKDYIDGQRAFCTWAMANGYRQGLTLDRRSNDGPYSPANCRWTDRLTQMSNTRQARLISVSLPISAWARILGTDHSTITTAISRGKDPADYITRRINNKYRPRADSQQ